MATIMNSCKFLVPAFTPWKFIHLIMLVSYPLPP